VEAASAVEYRALSSFAERSEHIDGSTRDCAKASRRSAVATERSSLRICCASASSGGVLKHVAPLRFGTELNHGSHDHQSSGHDALGFRGWNGWVPLVQGANYALSDQPRV